MLDWLASKVGVLIAVGVLTGFAVGIFAWQHSAMVDREGQVVADSISEAIDSIGSLEASTVMRICYGREAGQLPHTIGGKPYAVNITGHGVTVSSGGRTWFSRTMTDAIPQNLPERYFNLTEFQGLELAECSGQLDSGQEFIIERAMIDVSGEKMYLTLVYWE